MTIPISSNLSDLKCALLEGCPVFFDGKGKWKILKNWIHGLRKWFRQEESGHYYLLKFFCAELDRLEETPVFFGSQHQQLDFKAYLEIGEILIKQSKKFSSLRVQHEVHNLQYRLLAAKYRLEEENGGLNPQPLVKGEITNLLNRLAQEWKQEQAIFPIKGLTTEEIEKIHQIGCYPEFVKAIHDDKEIVFQLMNWILRDHNNPSIFIQYPSLQQKIMESTLSGRIGRLGGTALTIQKQKSLKEISKFAALQIEGRAVNILDEKKVITFRGNYRLTVHEIFEIFRNKHLRVGNLEFLAEGVINWNIHHLGWWNADKQVYERIDIDKKNWWDQLPIFEILAKDEVRKRYHCHLDGTDWNIAASATRGSLTLDYEKTHAFMEVAIPVADGAYAIYDFGKLAFNYPANFLETLGMFCEKCQGDRCLSR